MKALSRVSLLAILLFISHLIIQCESKKPLDPPIQPDTTHYLAYFAGSTADSMAAYNPYTNAITQTRWPFDINPFFTISADGRTMYHPTGTVVRTVDIATATEGPQIVTKGIVLESPDGTLLCVGGRNDSSLFVINKQTCDTIYHRRQDSVTAPWAISKDNRYLFCTRDTAGYYVYRIDLQDGSEIARRMVPGVRCFDLEITPDGRYAFMSTLVFQFNWYFDVYDFQLDTLIYREFITPGLMDIEVSADGKLAFYTNPGTLISGPPPWKFVKVFDVSIGSPSNTITFDTTVIPPTGMTPHRMVTTPTNSHVVVHGGSTLAPIRTDSLNVPWHQSFDPWYVAPYSIVSVTRRK